MTVAFSNSGEDVIHRAIHTNEPAHHIQNSVDLEDFYEISRCTLWINGNHFKKVGLQFPDHLLKDAVGVSKTLEAQTNQEMFILGDATYSSCCVDDIAAEHASVDAIIHYGHACFSPSRHQHVLYVFGKMPITTKRVVAGFCSTFTDSNALVIILCETLYFHVIDTIVDALSSSYHNLVAATHRIPDDTNSKIHETCNLYTKVEKCGQYLEIQADKEISDYQIFYIGSQDQKLLNLMLNFNKCMFHSFNPSTNVCQRETLNINKYLMKRYYYIEKAKDAAVIGILVGSIGASSYLDMVTHLKKIIQQSGKKAYLISVGKLSSVKLSNFPEIQVFVYVSCPECSVVDSHEFYQPVITPFELEVACNPARKWTGDYITDLEELLPGAVSHVPFCPSEEPVSDVSLITGKLRLHGEDTNCGAQDTIGDGVVVRDKMTVSNIHANSAGEFLASRIWQGLEQHLGETAACKVTQGKKGIASYYEGEHNE